MPSRRDFLRAAPAVLSAQTRPRPNLLLIITDQQSHSALSARGNPWLRTPAMDSLANAGTSFADAYCTYPVCSPSRSGIFTSRMPHETGVRVNGKSIAAGMPTMGEHFRGHGYRTFYGGKWHIPKPFGAAQGFEYIAGGSGLGADMDAPLADASVKWLHQAPKNEPFLLVTSFMNPHDICEWIRQHPGHHAYADLDKFPPAPGNMAVDPHEPDAMQYHRTAGYDKMSEGMGIASQWQRDDVRRYLHGYYRLVEDVDKQMGRVLAALRETSLDRNTIVAFVSDHGEGMGAHRWVQKAAFWEETVHVPLIFSGPGVAHRVDRQSLASLLDLFPTFCDYAGIPAAKGVQGRSLRPAIDGVPIDRPYVASEVLYGDQSREGRMIRSRRHKYVRFNNGARPEQFFDLAFDPGETTNLAASPHHAARLEEHRAMLQQWIRQTGDDFRVASY